MLVSYNNKVADFWLLTLEHHSEFVSSYLQMAETYFLSFIFVFVGLSMATHALIKSGSPTIGGLLFSRFGFPVFGIVGFAIDSIATVYLFLYGKDI